MFYKKPYDRTSAYLNIVLHHQYYQQNEKSDSSQKFEKLIAMNLGYQK